MEFELNGIKYESKPETEYCRGCAFYDYDVNGDLKDRDPGCSQAPECSGGVIFVHKGSAPVPAKKPWLPDDRPGRIEIEPAVSAPTNLPTSAAERKATPIATGVLDYFPLAIAEIARVSKAGNDQHNPGQPLHWARGKSTDHADCIVRHLIDRGTVDTDGMRHSAKVAWRSLALLQVELELADGIVKD